MKNLCEVTLTGVKAVVLVLNFSCFTVKNCSNVTSHSKALIAIENKCSAIQYRRFHHTRAMTESPGVVCHFLLSLIIQVEYLKYIRHCCCYQNTNLSVFSCLWHVPAPSPPLTALLRRSSSLTPASQVTSTTN